MNLPKYLPYLAILSIIFTLEAFAAQSDYERRHDQNDERGIRDFVQSKENVDIKEKSDHLEISGDMRFEWNHDLEKGERIIFKNGEYRQKYMLLQGKNALDENLELASANDWDVEFNLKIKYNVEKAWAMAHLQFDNPAGTKGYNKCNDIVLILDESPIDQPAILFPDDSGGFDVINEGPGGGSFSGSSSPEGIILVRDNKSSCKGSGVNNFINLKRCYMGYNIWADGVHRLDIEIGRQKLNDLFESEIQYSSRFDGVVLKMASAVDKIADWYIYAGGFVIDERVNHIGFAGEIGFLSVLDSDLDIKFSYVDWTKRGKNRCYIWNSVGSAFRNSQIFLEYHIDPTICGKTIPSSFYGAFVYNNAAERTIFTNHKKRNTGWYAGFFFGEAKKKGQWSVDIMYQYVGAQMASDCDVDGIGRGNILEERLTDIIYVSDGTPISSSIDQASLSSLSSSLASGQSSTRAIIPQRGNANFKGWTIEGLYVITDHFAIDVTYEFTHAADSSIGGPHKFRHFEIEALYTF